MAEILPEIDIKKELEKLKEKGYIKSLRKDNTGIGFTVETLLGIKENNLGNVVRGLKTACFATYATLTVKNLITGVKESAVVQKTISLATKAKTAVQTTIFGSKETSLVLKSLKAEKLALQSKVVYGLDDFARIEKLTDQIADVEKVLIAESKAGFKSGKIAKARSYLHNDAATVMVEKGKVLGPRNFIS